MKTDKTNEPRITRITRMGSILHTSYFILLTLLASPAFAQGPNVKATLMPNPSTTAAAGSQGSKAVATAGTPVKLVSSATLVESVEIFARKDNTTANTGNVYVGFSASGGADLRVLQPGESYTVSAPNGKKIDLSKIYIDAATNADAVVYTAVN